MMFILALVTYNLYCHNLCIKSYFLTYEHIFQKGQTEKPVTHKQQPWEQNLVVKDIEIGINQGFVRDCVNHEITSCKRVTNKKVNVLLLHQCEDKIRLSVHKEANKTDGFWQRCQCPTYGGANSR